MIPNDLLAELGHRGIQLGRNRDDLVVRGNRNDLDSSLLGQLRLHKASLLELVRGAYDETYFPTVVRPSQLPLVSLTQEEIDGIVAKVPGGAGNVQDIYPLAPLQEGILFHHVRSGDGDVYLLPTLLAFDDRGLLDRGVEALQSVIARHDVLRTAVVWQGVPEPVQVVWRQARLRVEEVTLARGDAAAQMRARFDGRRYRMDVSRAPLIEAKIAWDEEQDRWLMVLLLHHLVVDHEALRILLEEVRAHCLGQQARLPAPLPFRNFVARTRLGITAAEHAAFFSKMLADVEEPTLPFGLAEMQDDRASIAEVREPLDRALSQRIRERARTMGVSASCIFHLAWAHVLSRLSSQENVVFGTVLLGRMRGGDEAGRVLGLFINTLPIRVRVGEQSVVESLQQTHEYLAELLRHEHASLALVQRCSAHVPSTPLFSSLLNYRHSSRAPERHAAESGPGMKVLFSEVRTNYPLTLSIDDFGDDFSLTVLVVESQSPRRICELMRTALTQVVDALYSPHKAGREVDILPAAERNRVLYEWNDTEKEYPEQACLHELIERQARRYPERVAVSWGEERLTYGELNERANRLARHLRLHGVEPDGLVGLCVERGVQMVVGLLGVLKAGGAYVPLEPSDPAERLEAILRDARPRVLLTQERLKGELAGLAESIVSLDADWAQIERQESADLEAAQVGVNAGNLAYVIYTSGSTGVPKGVMVEHRNVVNYATYAAQRFAVEEGTGGVVATSVSFDLLLTGLYAPLICGREVRICGEGKDLSSLVKVITESRELSPVKLTPTHLAMLKESLPKEGWEAGVKTLVLGGEALQAEGLRWWRERSPGTRIFNHYGPTEATVGSVVHEVGEQSSGAVPIGRPINNVQIYILDEQRRPVPIGVVGEIYIGGAGVARGYWQREQLTAERFVEDPFSGRGRMYRTGDVGKWRETGEVEFLGRNDQQVKIRGYRIELGEIQARLLEHAAVREAVVLAREDEPGDQRLVAYVVYAQGALEEQGERADRAAQLRAHLAASLPEYMVPSALVELEHLPMTANGKLDRRALPAPEQSAYGSRRYEAPQGEIEEILAGIWQDILGVERVGRHDNFFELGGHSLLAIRLLESVRRHLRLSADVRALFIAPTLAGFAASLGARDEIVAPPNAITADCTRLTPDMLPLVDLTQNDIDRIVAETAGGLANIQDIYALSPLQDGILFHHLLATQGDPYLLVSVLAFADRALLDRYLAAFQQIIDRHDILRTAFHWKGLSNPAQVVHRRATLQLTEITLDPQRGPAAVQLAQRFDHRHHRLDVSKPPLLRFAVAFDAEHQRWLLVQLRHHLIGDHATSALLHENVRALCEGRAGELPAPRPFRNLVAQTRLGTTADEHERFFRDMLGDIDEPTLPFGIAARREGDAVGEARLLLPQSLNDRLRAQARRLGVSLASLCHLAWGQVLARASGRESAVFGTVLFGRMQAGEGADTGMGLFLNTLPFRIDLDGTRIEDAVRRTHARLADLLRHEHASLATAQRCSGLSAQTPLFSALLNYRHNRPRPPAAAESIGKPPPIAWISGQADNSYPLTLSVEDFGQTLGLTAQVVQPLSPERLAGYMQQALESLAEALECAADTPVRNLEVLPQEERTLLLHVVNRTESRFPEQACLQQLFEAHAARDAEALALVHQNETVSYGELNTRANRLARHLVALGVRPDDRVALCVERSLEMVVGLLAVLKAGGAYVPLDPTYPAERLAFMLADSAPALVLTHTRARAALAAATAGLQSPPAILDLIGDAARWVGESDADLSPKALGLDSRHLAYVIYTSGSTGRPKGVMVEHRSVANYLSWAVQTYSLRPGAVAPVNTSLSFDATATSLLAPLCSGGGVALLPEGTDELIALGGLLAQRGSCSLVKLTPAHLDSLIRLRKDAVTNDAAAALVIGGEALAAHQVQPWRERAPGTRLINEYGPTETTVGVVTYEIVEATPMSGPIPIGRPIANTRIYLLDEHRRPVPLGAVGEIYVGGAGVARGYLNRPELTMERFIASPFVPGDRLYKTGDLARYLPDGDLLFLGRSDQQVKIRGFRVELGEIEARLAEHADVREAIVLAREDQSGDKRLVAYVVHAGGDLAEARESGERVAALRAHLAARLPDYMVPAAFVSLDALPLTANGKVDRKALPTPGEDTYARRAYESPQGGMEQTLAAIWAELLGLERIGRNDDFFDAGGHSLVAIRLINAIEYRLGIALPLRTVFEQRTIVQLADTLNTHRQQQDAAGDAEVMTILEKIRLVRSMEAASTADILAKSE